MFKLEENEVIGNYLSKLIFKKFKSKRQFCIAYIKHTGNDANDDEIRKMANRITQITKGSKSIQIYDLPVFTSLLEVSCEEILSAGKLFVCEKSRLTNYSIAFSKSKEEWEKYISREDDLILKRDEYGETVIDYAIKFKNYEFLKFLIDKNYIWFDSRKESDYIRTFGAGTSIVRKTPFNSDDYLQSKLMSEDQLRVDIISLAIKNKDKSMLEELRARELPSLYLSASYLSFEHPKIDEHYNEDFLNSIADADNEIVDYFTNEFDVRDRIKYKDGSRRNHTFIFPFTSELLNLLIEREHEFAEISIKKIIDHNKKVYEALKKLIEKAIETRLSKFSYFEEEHINKIKTDNIKDILGDFEFYNDGSIVSFRDVENIVGIITNIAYIQVESENVKLKFLIGELNKSFENIVNIKDEFYKI